MKLFVAQINSTPGAVTKNMEKILKALSQAREKGAEIVVFPELVLSGAPVYDLLFHRDFVDSCEEALQKIAPLTKGLNVILGSPAISDGSLYNCAVVFQDGTIAGKQFQHMLRWEFGDKQVAILVGEEGQVSEKVDCIIHIAASPWNVGHSKMRDKLIAERAKATQTPYLFVNLIGANDEWIFDGASLYCDKFGQVVWKAESFEEESELVTERVGRELSPIEEIRKALVLGIRDYFTKQNVTKAHIALSGGLDSSVTASLAVEALSKDCVQGLFMPSRFTSKKSEQCIAALKEHLDIDVKTISIEPMVQLSCSMVEGFAEGVVLENIQSRIRTMMIMAFSNAAKSMVLGTGNKTEVTLGYSTLYGDLSGALFPLGDLFKSQVYDLAKSLHLPESIIERAPTAELRENQLDIDDLPEYEKLDPIVHALVLEGASVSDIVQTFGVDLPFVNSLSQRMWQAEYKRRQAPCILRVSTRAFGSEAKYPIVNGLRFE